MKKLNLIKAGLLFSILVSSSVVFASIEGAYEGVLDGTSSPRHEPLEGTPCTVNVDLDGGATLSFTHPSTKDKKVFTEGVAVVMSSGKATRASASKESETAFSGFEYNYICVDLTKVKTNCN